ncbi:MAG: protein kinase, partial [Anaerolineales bacterium]
VQRFAPVQHPRLVRLLGGGRSRGYLYYAVPYLAGGTLADRLADGPLEPDAALDILRDIAAALSHLHQEGIVHRDIKPSNIHFDAEGHALLGEVGVGPMLRAAASTFVQPAQLGPIAYRSPEQLAGRRKGSALDGRSDVYALGVLLFEALTGRPPYEAESAADLAMLQFTSPVPSARALRPPELSPLDPQLDDVLRIALSYSPKGRFASIAELMTAVTGALPIDLPASDVISVEPVSDVLPAAEAPSAPVRPAMGVQELLDLDVAPRPAPSPADLLMVDALELAPEAAAPAAAPIPAPGPAAVPAPVPRPRPTLAIVAAVALLGIMGIGAALAFAGPVVRGILRPQSSANIPTLVSAAAADTGNNGATAIPPTAGAASTVGQPTAAGDLGATGGGVSGGVVAVQTQTPSTESAGASATFVADAATVAIGASPTSQPAQPTSTQPPTSTPTPADTLTVVPTLALTETPTPTATPTLTASPTPTLGPAAGEDPAMAQAELEIVSLTNQQRAANGVAPALAAQVDVMSVAQGRSDDMQARDYFAHSDPVTGSIPAFDQLAGYGAVGENLFIISGSVPVDELPGHAISSWMSSTGHRANILDPVYAFIGVGVQFDDSCPTFGECWLVTQLFTSQVP